MRYALLLLCSLFSGVDVGAQPGAALIGSLTLPDGSGTPEIVQVINIDVGVPTSEPGVGNVKFGTKMRLLRMTLRIISTGCLVSDNSYSCAEFGNDTTVSIKKTGILDMQGGTLETLRLLVAGPVAGDAATGGR